MCERALNTNPISHSNLISKKVIMMTCSLKNLCSRIKGIKMIMVTKKRFKPPSDYISNPHVHSHWPENFIKALHYSQRNFTIPHMKHIFIWVSGMVTVSKIVAQALVSKLQWHTTPLLMPIICSVPLLSNIYFADPKSTKSSSYAWIGSKYTKVTKVKAQMYTPPEKLFTDIYWYIHIYHQTH